MAHETAVARRHKQEQQDAIADGRVLPPDPDSPEQLRSRMQQIASEAGLLEAERRSIRRRLVRSLIRQDFPDSTYLVLAQEEDPRTAEGRYRLLGVLDADQHDIHRFSAEHAAASEVAALVKDGDGDRSYTSYEPDAEVRARFGSSRSVRQIRL